MRRVSAIIAYFTVCLGACCLGFIDSSAGFEKIGHGILESQIQTLAVDPHNSNIVFAGTSKGVYKSVNAGRDFSLVFQASGSDGAVNHLMTAAGKQSGVYAATDSGLFVSRDEGKSFERMFSLSEENSRRCVWVAADEDSIYLGTKGGLYYKAAASRDWKKGNGMFANTGVNFIYANSDYFYLATENEVYRLGKNGDGIKKIFSLGSQEGATEEPLLDSGSAEDEAASEGQIMFLTEGLSDHKLLCLATARGIFTSDDCGETWQRVDSDGLPLEDATSVIAFSRQELLVGTKKGLFSFAKGRWSQMYKGLETNAVNFLLEGSGDVYAATEKGLYILSGKEGSSSAGLPDFHGLKKKFQHEPPIIEVQKMAIDYAEADLNKIKSWRTRAQMKALMPEVSLDFDKTVTTALGSTYDKTAVGPQDWGVNLKWDIAELVWSSDQTSIDSRSKLMVELREDVLDQVTRLYFERRRLQMEMASNPGLAGQELLDKEMRIEELTALLDGFTDGKFSEKVNKNNN